MKLSHIDIGAIEGWLNKDTVVEVHLTEEGVLVNPRPKETKECTLPFPALLSDSEDTEVTISVQAPSSGGPVQLAMFLVPPGYYLEGIKGYRKGG